MTYSERQQQIHRARDAFLRAAAALTEAATPNVLAFALLEGAIGMNAVANADEEHAALAVAESFLRAEKDARLAAADGD